LACVSGDTAVTPASGDMARFVSEPPSARAFVAVWTTGSPSLPAGCCGLVVSFVPPPELRTMTPDRAALIFSDSDFDVSFARAPPPDFRGGAVRRNRGVVLTRKTIRVSMTGPQKTTRGSTRTNLRNRTSRIHRPKPGQGWWPSHRWSQGRLPERRCGRRIWHTKSSPASRWRIPAQRVYWRGTQGRFCSRRAKLARGAPSLTSWPPPRSVVITADMAFGGYYPTHFDW